MTENLFHKNTFILLDQINHKFVDVPCDSNCLYYQFGIILHKLDVKDITINAIKLVTFMGETLENFWKTGIKVEHDF